MDSGSRPHELCSDCGKGKRQGRGGEGVGERVYLLTSYSWGCGSQPLHKPCYSPDCHGFLRVSLRNKVVDNCSNSWLNHLGNGQTPRSHSHTEDSHNFMIPNRKGGVM